MAGIVDGQNVNATDSNAAWLAKNGDDTAVGKIALSNGDPVSGSSVTNTQRELNSLASWVGKALNGVYNLLPTWVSNDAGTSGDDLYDRTEAVSAKFNASAGHAHTGAAGQAPKISVVDLSGNIVNTIFKTSDTPTTGSIELSPGSNITINRVGNKYTFAAGITGGTALSVVTKTSNYNVTSSDDVILANASGGGFSLTLPLASTIAKLLYIKKTDSSVNSLTILTTSSETIDGSTSQALSLLMPSVMLISNGSSWYIL